MELATAKAKVNKYVKNNNVDPQVAWDTFFFDDFIHRLSVSKYKNQFIFKGGFYLQSILGVETRSTMDIDFVYADNAISKDEADKIFNEILKLSHNNIFFRVIDVKEIRSITLHGGLTVRVEGKFYNIKKIFSIDIGFGDVVTPNPIIYTYTNSFTDENYQMLAYTIESAIAEKFETLISKGTNNSRSKDLLDLYLLNKKGFNTELLNVAIINTFYSRQTLLEPSYIIKKIDEVFSFERIKELYENFSGKNSFATSISFLECKRAVYSIYNQIKFIDKVNLEDYGVEVHIIRHGEDSKDMIGGWSDNHLTDVGIMQVKDVSKQVDSKYDLFISSDLVRARETAIIINDKLNIEVHFDERFREINNGNLKNLSKEEFNKNFKQFIFSKLSMNQAYPNGESPKDFYERIKASFLDIISNNKNKKILLVTHGGVITVITCLINGFVYSNLLKINVPLASLTKYK